MKKNCVTISNGTKNDETYLNVYKSFTFRVKLSNMKLLVTSLILLIITVIIHAIACHLGPKVKLHSVRYKREFTITVIL